MSVELSRYACKRIQSQQTKKTTSRHPGAFMCRGMCIHTKSMQGCEHTKRHRCVQIYSLTCLHVGLLVHRYTYTSTFIYLYARIDIHIYSGSYMQTQNCKLTSALFDLRTYSCIDINADAYTLNACVYLCT